MKISALVSLSFGFVFGASAQAQLTEREKMEGLFEAIIE